MGINRTVLIPLLLDDPLWGVLKIRNIIMVIVLIPLLLDDPLWVCSYYSYQFNLYYVLIPLLLDDPLWVIIHSICNVLGFFVLIPLLLDDPLWDFQKRTLLKMAKVS